MRVGEVISINAVCDNIWITCKGLAVSLVILTLMACGTRNRSARASLVRVDAPMDYTWILETPDGKPVRMADFRGKVLFINVWATWCAPCIAELDSIERLAWQLKDQKEMAFLIVSEEDRDAVQKFVRRYPHELPIYIAPQGRPHVLISPAYPVTFIVSKSGRIVASKEGPSSWDSKGVIGLLKSLLSDTSDATHMTALKELPSGDLPNASTRLRFLYPYHTPDVYLIRSNAMALDQKGQYAQAEVLGRKFLTIVEKDGDTMTTASALAFLGTLSLKQGQLRDSDKLLSRALTIAETRVGASSYELIPYLGYLGETYNQESKVEAATQLHQRAIVLAKRDIRTKSALPWILRDLAKDERKLGRPLEADLSEQEADQVEKELSQDRSHH